MDNKSKYNKYKSKYIVLKKNLFGGSRRQPIFEVVELKTSKDIRDNQNRIQHLLNSAQHGVHISTVVPFNGSNIPHSYIIYNNNNNLVVFDYNNDDVYSNPDHNKIVKPSLDTVIANWTGPQQINWAADVAGELHTNAKNSCQANTRGYCSQYVTTIESVLLNQNPN
jgi:hypothetical protein